MTVHAPADVDALVEHELDAVAPDALAPNVLCSRVGCDAEAFVGRCTVDAARCRGSDTRRDRRGDASPLRRRVPRSTPTRSSTRPTRKDITLTSRSHSRDRRRVKRLASKRRALHDAGGSPRCGRRRKAWMANPDHMLLTDVFTSPQVAVTTTKGNDDQ